jgi:hypothetical protein
MLFLKFVTACRRARGFVVGPIRQAKKVAGSRKKKILLAVELVRQKPMGASFVGAFMPTKQ